MVQLLSDTIPNYPPAIVEKYNIHLIPTYVTIGTEVVRDYIDLSSEEFYRRLPLLDNIPFTSQPSVNDFIETYSRIRARHPDEPIISIHPSLKLTGTVQSARKAVEKMDATDSIHVFDTYSVGVAQGMMTLEAARMCDAGESVEAIMQRMQAMRSSHEFFMALDTLEYLAKRGRIGRAARVLGTLLDMKPIIGLVEGEITSHSRHRSFDRAINALAELLVNSVGSKQNVRLGIAHSAVPDKAKALADRVSAVVDAYDILIAETGPSLGAHVGPGTLAIAWWAP
ncbi:MAG: DegV family protein [Anaerolineae bacterium]